MPTLRERIVKGWNAFRNKDPTPGRGEDYLYSTYSSYYRPDRRSLNRGGERSIIAPILNRIAVDAAAIDIRHVMLDEYDRYKADVKDELNALLTLEANLDQTSREFKQDVYMSMLDEGYVAVCPIIADVNYATLHVNAIQSARVGRIMAWYPKEIDVELYNEDSGKKETVRMPKQLCVIVQNPFYDIMNAPNSVMARLRRKLALLDQQDEKSASGKLDMIIQLPYSTRHETQQQRAKERQHDLEVQLNNSKYGIGYIDASEKVIQLGRSLDNNLQGQIDSLTKQLHDQLGVSPEILNGNANEMAKLNYVTNILEPIVSKFVDEMKRKWLTPTARTQGHTIMSFHNAFRLVPVTEVAKLGDTLLRNTILTPNEMRGILGFKPSDQQGADELSNPNMPIDMQGGGAYEEIYNEENLPAEEEAMEDEYSGMEEIQNGSESQ